MHVLGREHPAVIDPGPADPDHLEALDAALGDARSASLLLTHGHADHVAAVEPLRSRLRARGVGVTVLGSGFDGALPLREGARVETEAGVLVTLPTPGHTPDHLAFHWPAARALFAGDLLMGRGDTTWVAGYAGCVADYLDSLRRMRTLDLEVIFPAHGPPLTDPGAALERFEEHRRQRIERVRQARSERPDASLEALLPMVYGDTVPSGLEGAALESLAALVAYVERNPEE